MANFISIRLKALRMSPGHTYEFERRTKAESGLRVTEGLKLSKSSIGSPRVGYPPAYMDVRLLVDDR
jgi:hypothetical protein